MVQRAAIAPARGTTRELRSARVSGSYAQHESAAVERAGAEDDWACSHRRGTRDRQHGNAIAHRRDRSEAIGQGSMMQGCINLSVAKTVARGVRVLRRSCVLKVCGVVLACACVLGLGGDGFMAGAPASTLAAPLAGLADAPLGAPDSSIVLLPFISGLSSPVFMTQAGDNSGRFFVVEQGGK